MQSSFQEYILDELGGLEDVRSRPMFGGFGLYQGEIFFGIIHRDSLYFKTSEKSRKNYEKYGMEPFRPNEKQTIKTYYEVPADIIENKEKFVEWAESAIGCAQVNFGIL